MDTTADKIRQELEQTKQKAEELQTRIDELEAALKVIGEFEPENRNQDGPLSESNMNLGDACEYVLEMIGEAASASQVADHLLDLGYPYAKGRKKLERSVSATLSRIEKERSQIVKVSRGLYKHAGNEFDRIIGNQTISSEEIKEADLNRETPEQE